MLGDAPAQDACRRNSRAGGCAVHRFALLPVCAIVAGGAGGAAVSVRVAARKSRTLTAADHGVKFTYRPGGGRGLCAARAAVASGEAVEPTAMASAAAGGGPASAATRVWLRVPGRNAVAACLLLRRRPGLGPHSMHARRARRTHTRVQELLTGGACIPHACSVCLTNPTKRRVRMHGRTCHRLPHACSHMHAAVRHVGSPVMMPALARAGQTSSDSEAGGQGQRGGEGGRDRHLSRKQRGVCGACHDLFLGGLRLPQQQLRSTLNPHNVRRPVVSVQSACMHSMCHTSHPFLCA